MNRKKSVVDYITRVKFLGYSFYQRKGEGSLRIHAKSAEKMRNKIRELTSRSNGWGNARRKEALRQYITGWVNYFKYADMKILLRDTDEWYRRRLRMVLWKQWKLARTRWRNLMKLGIDGKKAWEYACSRLGYWHLAKSWVLSTSVTNERLRGAGYLFMMDYYLDARKLN